MTKPARDSTTSVVKLKDRDRGHLWLTVRDGIVVGAMGSEPERYMGMTLKRAKHVARYGGTGTKVSASHDHAVIARANNSGLKVGDIVQRSDIDGRNRYVVINIQSPWVYTRRISGSGGPGIITFPSSLMLRKVD